METRRDRQVHFVVLLSLGLAAVATVTAFQLRPGISTADLVAAGMLGPMVTVCRLFPLHVGYRRKVITDSAPLFAAALLLPAWLAVAVAGIGIGVAELSGRGPGFRDPRQALFNSSQAIVGVAAAAAVFAAIPHGSLMSSDPLMFVAVVAACGAMFATNDVLLLAVIMAQLGRGVVRDFFSGRGDIPHDLALYASGFVAALAATFHLWLLPVLVFPVVVFHRALRDQVTLRTQTREAVEALADVVDMRDPYTFEHSKRVAEYARGICEQLELSQDLADEIVAAARVHDVGKVGVRDSVLLKPGRLTAEEYAEIQQHPDIGARLTARFPDFGSGTRYIRHHHEKWDGSGYPLGLGGKDIPLGARVIAVADTYDAITSERVYRPALSEEWARQEMSRAAGSQLDPEIVMAFFRYKGWTVPESARALQPAAYGSGAAQPV
ncbi:MAG: hypothetical protein Kow0010_24010 [Dehalococcoidia bacterium]